MIIFIFISDDNDVVSNYFSRKGKKYGLLSLFNYAKDSVLPQRSKKSFWISLRLSTHLQQTCRINGKYHLIHSWSYHWLNLTSHILMFKKTGHYMGTTVFTPLNLSTNVCMCFVIHLCKYILHFFKVLSILWMQHVNTLHQKYYSYWPKTVP
jgi:hypothetical protein